MAWSVCIAEDVFCVPSLPASVDNPRTLLLPTNEVSHEYDIPESRQEMILSWMGESDPVGSPRHGMIERSLRKQSQTLIKKDSIQRLQHFQTARRR